MSTDECQVVHLVLRVPFVTRVNGSRCHPPVGAILFVGCAVGKVTIEEVMRKIWPFYGVMFAVLMLVTYLPTISLWLPHLLGL
jgi:TRAP-type C4-dicarboxylate transport system permease large subunit